MAAPVRLSNIQTDSLPMRVQVLNEMCGVSTGDHLDLYFAKNTKMIEMISSQGNRYMLPMSSSLECSILYNPEGNFDKAVNGYTFDSACEIKSANQLPRMICVETGWFSHSTSVDPEDVLILSGRTSGGVLVFIDINTLETKNIGEECDCSFTTDPQCLFMPISKFIHLNELPTPIVFKTLLTNGRREMFTVINVYTAQSVIGRIFKHPSQADANEVKLIELFLDVPLKLKVVDHHTATLSHDAHMAFQKFHPSLRYKVIINDMVYENNDTQKLFLSCISQVEWESLIQVFPPLAIPKQAISTG